MRDHVFDPNFVDPQLGTLVILKALMALDASIRFPADNVVTLPMQQGAVPRPPALPPPDHPPPPPPPDVEPVPPRPVPPAAKPGIFATFWKNFTKRG